MARTSLLEHFIKSRILKMVPEQSIMDTLKDFGITQEDTEFSMVALGVLERDNINILEDGTITFKSKPDKISLYANNKTVYLILKEIYGDKCIFRAHIKDLDSKLILDMDNYSSVKRVFDIIKSTGHTVKNDKELINYAINRLCPPMRFIKCKQRLGKEAFNGSSIKQYEIDRLICYDIDLILSIEEVK